MRETISLSQIIEKGLIEGVDSFAFDDIPNSQIYWSYCIPFEELEFMPYKGGELVFIDEKREMSDIINCIEYLETKGVTSLCLKEWNRYEEVIDCAREYGFNIFFFKNEVDFIKESIKVNAYLIELDGEFYFKSNRFLECLEELEKSSGIPEFVKYTSLYLQIDVAYWHILSEPIVYGRDFRDCHRPLSDGALQKADLVKEYEVIGEDGCIFMKIPFLTERYAYVIFKKDGEFDRFERHILKRFTNFLKPIVTARFVKQLQKEHFLDTSWASGWFAGNLSRSSVIQHLKSLGISTDVRMICAMCCSLPANGKATVNYEGDINSENRLKNDITVQISANIFRPFKTRGFKTITLLEDNILKFVILTPLELEDYETKFLEATKVLEKRKDIIEGYSGIRICYGKKVNDFEHLYESHSSAMYLLNMTVVKNVRVMRFEDYYQLWPLEEMKKQEMLDSYIKDTLKELVDPDNNDLLKTLTVYFESGFSKQKTVEILKVARQTVYSRLCRIAEILGYDFETGNKRLAIELSLRALQFYSIDKMSS